MKSSDIDRFKVNTAKANRNRRLTGGWATDPTPGPYPGRGPITWRRYETPEQRAFRRFPIDRHKPR
jgi:hypothetical protein